MNPLLYVRIAGAAIVALLIGLLVWKGNQIYRDAKRVPELEREIAQLVADRTQLAQDYAKVQEASNDFQTELAALRIAAARARPVVRLCPSARVPERREIPAGGSGPPAAAPGSGSLQEGTGGDPRPGSDIGPELFALAERADELSAQTRALQTYARACSAPNLPVPTR